MDLVDQRQLAGLRLLPLAVPALELPLDVVLLLAEVAEADGVGVDGVDLGHRVGDGVAGVAARLGADRRGGGLVAEHEPVDEGHHVERRAVHLVVGAEAEGGRDRHVGGTEGGDDLVLAAHVVGGGEHVAERRAAQHEAGAVGVGDAVGEVGVPAGDEIEGERALRAVDVRLEPLGDPRDVDTLDLGHHPSSPGARRPRWARVPPPVHCHPCRSTSPTPPSPPRWWSGRSRCPWWSTCGRSGAARARRSARSSRR